MKYAAALLALAALGSADARIAKYNTSSKRLEGVTNVHFIVVRRGKGGRDGARDNKHPTPPTTSPFHQLHSPPTPPHTTRSTPTTTSVG
jgi:hypothetical protein